MPSSARQTIGTDVRTGSLGPSVPRNDVRGALTSLGSPAVFERGQLLDNTYRIVRLIGEGGMGLVYEATHARLAGRYAIKVILQGLSGNLEASARFDREARITSWLQHPNIVQVVDFNRLADGTEYLVMEFLQGETLAERLLRNEGPFPLSSVVSIVHQISSALAAAHSHGIVHRDLKPANISLLPVEGSAVELVKVLDFGISKVHDATEAFRGAASGLMGTPQYMAPEQCRGERAAMNGASDQFSLAVLTYEMLTGVSPFFDHSVGGVLSRVLYEAPPAMGLSPAIEQVVLRGLAKAAQDRFPSVLAFADALHAATSPAPVAAGEPPRAKGSADGDVPDDDVTRGTPSANQTVALKGRRGRWTIALAAVASLAALVGVLGAGGLGKRLFRRPPMVLSPELARPDDVRGPALKVDPPARQIIPVESGLTPTERAPAAVLARYRRHHQRADRQAPARAALERPQAPRRRDVSPDDNEILPPSFGASP